MLKKLDLIELIVVVICLLFTIAISFYHVAQDGDMGLTQAQWRIVWAISENGLSLVMSFLISLLTVGIVKIMFKWLFVPYFVLKLIYHISCYSGIYLLSRRSWEFVWSFIIVYFIVFAVGYCLFLIKKKNVD
jgi:hypothetical protein